MAYPRLSPHTPTAQQLRSNIGVNTGGTRGRTTQTHKGVGLNRNSGGLNAQGSGRRLSAGVSSGLPRPTYQLGRPPARPTKGQPGFDGGRLPMPVSRPGNVTGGVKSGLGGGPNPTGGAKPWAGGGSTGAPGAVEPTRPSGPLDYRGLSSYIGSMADLNLRLGGDRAELQSQLGEAQRQYALQRPELERGYARQVESSEDQMNRAGLLRSGVREVEDADRFREFNRYMSDLEEQYGAGASAKINQALARLDEFELQQRQAIEQQARMDYDSMYPAAPISIDSEGSVSPPAGSGAAAPSGGSPAPASPAAVKYMMQDIAAGNRASTVRPGMAPPVPVRPSRPRPKPGVSGGIVSSPFKPVSRPKPKPKR